MFVAAGAVRCEMWDINLGHNNVKSSLAASYFSPGRTATTSGVPPIILLWAPSQVAGSVSRPGQWAGQGISRPLRPLPRQAAARPVQAEHRPAECRHRDDDRPDRTEGRHQLQRAGAGLHLGGGRPPLPAPHLHHGV